MGTMVMWLTGEREKEYKNRESDKRLYMEKIMEEDVNGKFE